MKQRIQKVLAAAGVDSRRHVEEMVLQGRVTVNGKVLRDLPILIDPEKDKVEVDGERIKLKSAPLPARPGGKGARGGKRGSPRGGEAEGALGNRLYFLLYKPKGVYATNVAQGVQTRAIDLLPEDLGARLYPVGRLDAQSKGLLLLTNDGDLTNRLTHPRYGVSKTYRAVVDGYVRPEVLDEIQRGVWVTDRSGKSARTGRSLIRIGKRTSDRTILEITFREGRDLQLRRAFAKLGHKVRELTRVKMGPLTLEGLSPGHYRQLTPREVRLLRKLGEDKPGRAGPPGKGAVEDDADAGD